MNQTQIQSQISQYCQYVFLHFPHEIKICTESKFVFHSSDQHH